MADQAMVEEFDTFAEWTADAVAELGPEFALPAACRGSGSPAALDWLASRLDLGPGSRLLDSGAGVGGPAAYAASTRGARPFLVEPMEGACSAAARLFSHPVVVGDGSALPFVDGLFDAAWSLGVLDTVQDKASHLTELARMISSTAGDGGKVGLLVFVRTVEQLPEKPEGNEFPDRPELQAELGRAGLRVLHETLERELPPPPHAWQQAATEVDTVIKRDHGDKEGFRIAQQQSEQIGRLISEGLVVAHLLVCCTTPTQDRD